MRYLLFIFLFVSLGAGAQVYQNQSAPMQFTRGTKHDTILVIPRGCDTTALPVTKYGARTMGAVYFDTCNNVLYARGSYGWVSVATGSDIPNYIDSTGNTTNAVLFAIAGRIHGSTRLTYDSTNGIIDVNGTSPQVGTSYKLRVNGSAYLGGQVKIGTPPTTTDTTNYKPLVIQRLANNIIYSFDYWPVVNDPSKMKISDTAAMLSPYARTANVPTQFSPIAGTNITLSGTYPNITFNATGSDTTGTGALYIRNTTTQEDKRFNVRAGRLDSLLSASSGGLRLYSNNGTEVLHLGSGGGNNATFSGGVNIDGTTRLATSLNGILKATIGTVSAATAGTDFPGLSTHNFFTTRNSLTSLTLNKDSIPITTSNLWFLTIDTTTNLVQRRDYNSQVRDSIAVLRYGNTLARNLRSFNAGGQTASAAVVNQSSSTADSSNILLGYLSGRDLTTGYRNYFIGDNAGATTTTGHTNVAIGYNAYGLTGAKTGFQNIAIGEDALRAATSISNSIAIGYRALRAATTTAANGSISIGFRSSENITTGSNNVVIANYGSTSQMGATSRDNTHIGYQSASGISSATILQNTSYFGSETGTGATGNGNTGIGRQALLNATGNNNIGLGFGAGNNASANTLSGGGNILIGAGAKPMSYTASNQFTLWAAANGSGTSGYNRFSIDSTGRAIFNLTTSEVTAVASGAAFEINGTAGGFLMPRGTSAQRTAISAPATGLQYYDTDSSSIMYYNGTRWQPLDKRDNIEATISGNVAMTSANTYYSGPSIVLPVGTWDVSAHASFLCNASGNTEIQLWDGTNLLSGVTIPFTSGRVAGGALSDIITVTSGTLTITLRAYANTAGNTMYQNTPLTSTPNATYIKAVRIR